MKLHKIAIVLDTIAIVLIAVLFLTAGSLTEHLDLSSLTLSGAFRARSTARVDGAATFYGNADFGDDASDITTFHREVVAEDSVHFEDNITLDTGKLLRVDAIVWTKPTSAKPDTTTIPDGYTFVTASRDTRWTLDEQGDGWQYEVLTPEP